MMKEKAIRDQIAEKFTLEMKTMEMNCARRIKEMENEHLGAITKLKELLERKAKEVETLKEFILSERGKVTQILESKENEISVLIKEHNELQAECQKANDEVVEWRLKSERYKERITRLGSLENILKHEREEWRQRSSSSVKECQGLKVKLSELQAKIVQLERKYDKLQSEHVTLQDKYKNVKKTVFTYKVTEILFILCNWFDDSVKVSISYFRFITYYCNLLFSPIISMLCIPISGF